MRKLLLITLLMGFIGITTACGAKNPELGNNIQTSVLKTAEGNRTEEETKVETDESQSDESEEDAKTTMQEQIPTQLSEEMVDVREENIYEDSLF